MFNWTGQFLRPTGRCLSTRSTSWTQEHSTSEWDEWDRTTMFSPLSDCPAQSARSCSGKHGDVWFWLQCRFAGILLIVSHVKEDCGILSVARSISQWVTESEGTGASFWAADWGFSESFCQCDCSYALAGGACFCLLQLCSLMIMLVLWGAGRRSGFPGLAFGCPHSSLHS